MVPRRRQASAPARGASRSWGPHALRDDDAHTFALLSVILTIALRGSVLAIQQIGALEHAVATTSGSLAERLPAIRGLRAALAEDVLETLLPRVPLAHSRTYLVADLLTRLQPAAQEAGFSANVLLDGPSEANHDEAADDVWSHDGARRYIRPFDGAILRGTLSWIDSAGISQQARSIDWFEGARQDDSPAGPPNYSLIARLEDRSDPMVAHSRFG